MSDATRRWFECGGAAYARFRPEYPPELARGLAAIAPATRFAVDVGCGSGQLTCLLASHFTEVVGVDPSADQLAHAVAHDRVRYLCSSAESLQLPPGTADLITAAQAAHWFDLPSFYAEVRRVASPRAVVALVSYGVLTFESAEIDRRVQSFYADEIGRFWPPERRMVDQGYSTLSFPFEPCALSLGRIEKHWTIDEFLGYVSTWSAVRSAQKAGQGALLDRFARDLAEIWGGHGTARTLSWPINARTGRVLGGGGAR